MEQQENANNGESIRLVDILAILVARKRLIIGMTLGGLIAIVVLSTISLILPSEKSFLPNMYAPKAYMLINDPTSSSEGLSSLIGTTQLSSLASSIGFNITSGSTYSALAVFLAESNGFLDSVVDKFGMIERYKVKKYFRAQSRIVLKKHLTAVFDSKSGVFSISFSDIDPAFARSVVNYTVEYMEKRFDEMGLDKNKIKKENLELNIKNTYNDIRNLEIESQGLDRSVAQGTYQKNGPSIVLEATRIKREIEAQESIYKELKTQLELLKVTMASDTPIFQILEYAEIPDMKSSPSRVKICLIATLSMFFLSIIIALLSNEVDSIKNDPSTLAKFRGHK